MQAALPLMIASTAMKAVGSIVSGQQEAKGMKAQASIADANATAASQQASQRQDQLLRTGRQQIGEQSAAAAESGAGMGGSNLDIIKQSEDNLSMDVLNAGYEGALQRTSYTNQARGLRKAASDKLAGGWIGAGTAALQGAASYAMGGGKLPGLG